MASLSPLGTIDLDSGMDPNASPLGSVDSNTTPDTEFSSPPESPYQDQDFLKYTRAAAKKKLSQLTQEEKVSMHFRSVHGG
jgi:beta-glucosidase